MLGQDGPGGSPSEKRRKRLESERSTKTVKLRLAPPAADALAEKAALRRMTLSGFVTMLLDLEDLPTRGRPPSVSPKFCLLLDEVSRLAQAVHQIPDEVARLRGELDRQGGLVKHLVAEGYADRYRRETAETILKLKEIAGKAEQALRELLEATAVNRNQLGRATRVLASLRS